MEDPLRTATWELPAISDQRFEIVTRNFLQRGAGAWYGRRWHTTQRNAFSFKLRNSMR
jgi:hypothetical protein